MTMPILAPRAFVSLGGGGNIPCKTASVTRKGKRSADTFTADLSIHETSFFGMGFADWADYQPQQVTLSMSTMPGGGDLTPILVGMIDMPKINWETCEVTISGRDMTASLIETRRSQKFSSQKSSDIASQIAQDNGLQPQAQSTSSYAGKSYVDNDTNHLVIHRTDFEVLSDLADREGFEWFVDGTSLIFQPTGQSNGNVFQAIWAPPSFNGGAGASANIWGLETSRNMTAAKPTSVNVKSFHPMQKTQYDGAAQAQGIGNPITIEGHHNGKTQDEADTLAMSRCKDAIRHELNVSFSAPIDITVDPKTTQVQLTGTGTIYDQLYDIDEAVLSVGFSDGGEIKITAKGASQSRSVTQGGGDTSSADSAAQDTIST